MSGAETWSAVERSVGGFWSMTRSQVYQELKKLVDAGLAEDAEHGRYAITAQGRDAVRDWFHGLALAEPQDDQVRSPLTLIVFFGHYLPRELLARVVQEHRLRLERRLEALGTIERSLQNDESLPGLTLRRALVQSAGMISWTDEVLSRTGVRPTAERVGGSLPGRSGSRRDRLSPRGRA
jgi:DNA-binding PadR family transcriptional regulator